MEELEKDGIGGKPTEEGAPAPAMDKPEAPEAEAGEVEEAPSTEDLSAVIELLNEADKLNGGSGSITNIPGELSGSIKFIAEKMIALRDAFKDPYLKEVLDDMVDQREDGKTPSLIAAVARVVPFEELQAIFDSEDYEGAQRNVEEGLAKRDEEKRTESELYAKFDESKGNIEAYVAEMGYNPEEAERLYKRIAKLRDIFADGLITKEEVAEIDKSDKYDEDIASLQSQIPKEPVKEVLPDRASMEEQMSQATAKPAAVQPKNSIEALGAGYSGGVDVTQIGKRKFAK